MTFVHLRLIMKSSGIMESFVFFLFTHFANFACRMTSVWVLLRDSTERPSVQLAMKLASSLLATHSAE